MRSGTCRITIFALVALTFLSSSIAYADNIYVSCFSYGKIQKFNSSGTGTNFASGLDSPAGLAFDRSGNLYAASAGGGTIKKYNSSGYGTTFASGLGEPAGLAFDNSGNLYVSDYAQGLSGTIYKFNSSGSKTTFASGLSGGIWGLTCDSSGNLYGAGNGAIYKFNPSGTKTVFASGSELYGSEDLTFDKNGYLYVSCGQGLYGEQILKFNQLGQKTTFASGLYGTGGLAFDSGGNLYDGCTDGIYKFDPSGNKYLFASGLNYTTSFIAIQVPEPCTLLLLGLGAAVAVRKKRAKGNLSRRSP
jgi:sugar lactone lactonase YvrE